MKAKGFTPSQRAQITAALEALKAHGCITSYTFGDSIESITPHWTPGGPDVVLNEFNNRHAFGLRSKERGWLLLVLPKEARAKFDNRFMAEMKKRYNL
jgi:hypothetical protein